MNERGADADAMLWPLGTAVLGTLLIVRTIQQERLLGALLGAELLQGCGQARLPALAERAINQPWQTFRAPCPAPSPPCRPAGLALKVGTHIPVQQGLALLIARRRATYVAWREALYTGATAHLVWVCMTSGGCC